MANKVEIIINADGTRAIKAMTEVGATARETGKANAEAGKAAALAAKFAGDTITSESVRIIQAREKERVAAADYAKLQALTRKGTLDEAAGVTATAAAYQRLAEAKKHLAEVQPVKPVKPPVEEEMKTPAMYLRERMMGGAGSLDIREGMGGATMALAGTVAIAGELANKMREVVSEALEFGEAMERASQKTGLSVGTLSVLKYAASTTGGDFDSMTAAVAKMDQTIAKATEGNKTAQAFMKSLGLNARELADSTDGAEVAFQKFASTLAATENPIRRGELARGLLGKAGAEQIPTLIELGERWEEFSAKAEAAGEKLDAKTAKSLAETNQKLKEMRQTLQGAGLQIAVGFTPFLSKMLDVMTDGKGAMDSMNQAGERLGKTFAFIAEAANRAMAAQQAFFGVIEAFIPGMGDVARADLAGASGDWKRANSYGDIVTGKAMQKSPGLGDDASDLLDRVNPNWRGKPKGGEGFEGVGDLTNAAEKENEKRLKAMEAELAAEKLQTNVSVKAEYDYWDARRNAFETGSNQYNAIIEKQAQLAAEGSRKASEVIRRFQQQQLSNDRDFFRMKMEVEHGSDAMAKDRYDAAIEALSGQARVQQAYTWGDDRLREFNLGAYGTNAGGAVRETAAMHTSEYSQQAAELQRRMSQTQSNPYLDQTQRQKQIDALNQETAALTEARNLQIAEDQKRIESTTLMGGANDALREFVLQSTNAGAAMKQWFGSSLSTTNDAIVRSMTGEKPNWGQAGHEIFANASSTLLRGAEGKLLGAFGIGGKKDGSSEANAMWVQIAKGAGGSGLPKIPGMTDSMGTLPGGSFLSQLMGGGEDSGGASSGGGTGGFVSGAVGLLMHLLPGFADGVSDFGGGMALVGEKGPELVNLPHGSSVIPNHALAGRGDMHYHVDARGSTDPAATEAAVHRGILAAAPRIAAMAIKGGREQAMRSPSTKR